MITLFRIIKIWQIKVKWKLALWQYADNKLMEIIKNPEELEKKFIDSLTKIIHENNNDKTE